ncbi:hypothetical protein F2Q68_00044705 [Brassica cretica]|uniref:Uncharacterized protein n=1 Tax=Brassica cretica TaxID=69181 RepID=A0A8S9LPK9_BRACR|nr:hypothetical protein F2Q68_00044705 [Brassica cretica]
MEALRREDVRMVHNLRALKQLINQPNVTGVKAAKGASGKRTIVDGKALSEFQTMWSTKEKDLAVEKKLSEKGLLIAKPEPLSEEEEALKKKLITEMLST